MELHETEIQDLHLTRHLSLDQQQSITQSVSEDEIKRTVFAMDGSKAPGPDGFNATFFKTCWPIVGNEVTSAIQGFFLNPFMPRAVNSTFLCLIPKVECPTTFADFRPIALCNVLYKIIGKILANRLQQCISYLVAGNQSAFIKGRSIADNMLICHDIVRGIDRKSSPPIAVMKVDLHKAYDSINRQYLMQILAKMGFPSKALQWIGACIHTPRFSVLVNGSPAGYFKGDRGIRQGDPLSPYLFTLAMEPLSILLDNAVQRRQFEIPHRCKSPSISHLMFADDLMLFSKAKSSDVQGMMNTLNSFAKMSGLRINFNKSAIIMGGVDEGERRQIIADSGFKEGTLPISYLGIPLVQASLSARDCEPILLKIRKKIEGWKCRFLSYAGRLQLLSSVIQSSYIYWAGLFGLPKKTCSSIESMMANFLWSGPDLKRKALVVSWARICLPKDEGGLGLRRVQDTCKAGVMKLFWSILTNKDTLWVQWIKTKYLKQDSIWNVKNSKNYPWTWRNILHHRDFMRQKTSYVLGTGTNTLFWLDPWLGNDTLWSRLDNAGRGRFREDKMASVRDYRMEDSWIDCPLNDNPACSNIWTDLQRAQWKPNEREDKIMWISTSGQNKDLIFKEAWESCRSRGHKVSWAKTIWLSTNVSKHSFVTWRACLEALPTADHLRIRNISINPNCRLCANGLDDQEHLFFECAFSSFVWKNTMNLCCPRIARTGTCATEAARLDSMPARGRDISCITKLMFNAIVYNIWKERNSRSFGGRKKTKEEVCRDIIRGLEDTISSIAFHRPNNPLEVFLSSQWAIDVH